MPQKKQVFDSSNNFDNWNSLQYKTLNVMYNDSSKGVIKHYIIMFGLNYDLKF